MYLSLIHISQREIPAAWVDALADAMGQGLPLYRATHAAVSYTHLDVYKRQVRASFSSRVPA